MSEQAIDVTRAVFEAFATRDFDRALDGLLPDVRIEFYGTPDIPYAGEYQGHAGARRFFESVHASVEILEFVPEQFLPSGDVLVVTGRLHLRARATGREFRSPFVHVITLHAGRWARFRDFMNTAVAVDAFRSG